MGGQNVLAFVLGQSREDREAARPDAERPPIGLCLNGACKVGGIPLESALRDILPFLLLGFALLIARSYFPMLSLWLPTLIFGG